MPAHYKSLLWAGVEAAAADEAEEMAEALVEHGAGGPLWRLFPAPTDRRRYAGLLARLGVRDAEQEAARRAGRAERAGRAGRAGPARRAPRAARARHARRAQR